MKGLWDLLASIPDKLYNMFDSIGSTIVDTFTSLVDKIWTFIKEKVLGGATKVVKSAWNWMKGGTEDDKLGDIQEQGQPAKALADSVFMGMLPATQSIMKLVEILAKQFGIEPEIVTPGRNLVDPIPGFLKGGFIKKDLFGKLDKGEIVVPRGAKIATTESKVPDLIIKPEVMAAREQSVAQTKTEKVIREIVNKGKSAANTVASNLLQPGTPPRVSLNSIPVTIDDMGLVLVNSNAI